MGRSALRRFVRYVDLPHTEGDGMEGSSTEDIHVWEDDPGAPPTDRHPIRRPRPRLDEGPLRVELDQPEPAPDSVGTDAFRYWTAAEALRRGVALWATVLPSGTAWNASVGARLRVELDKGEDLNAYYTREGLEFYHDTVNGTVCYSGESPDILCHELGHAVLDAIRPELWSVVSIEAAAFHESFGDVSAILAALQLPSVRERVLTDTQGRLWRSSRVSRVAEQLGWGIRTRSPGSADADSLRNAANSWFYSDPASLPPQAPASALSSAPHSFSRVFTGAFLKMLAGMLTASEGTDEALVRCTSDAAQLLVDAIGAAPIVPQYFSSVGAQMVAADAERFEGRYRDAIKFGLVRHGILALPRAAALTGESRGARALGMTAAPLAEGPPLARLALRGADYGLPLDVLAEAPSATPRFRVAPAAADTGDISPQSADRAAASYAEDLFRLGRVDIGSHGEEGLSILGEVAFKTHELRAADGGLMLSRRLFDCGFK
jgi:hypothetical protein